MTDPADAPDPSAPPPPRRRWWHRWKLYLALLIAVPVLFFVLYTWSALSWSYSEGERTGYLQRFSKKGWVCKTWEGEIALTTSPGVAPVMWYFTVRKDDVARQVQLASGRRVVVYYEEHVGLPTRCFGDTNFFVDSIRILR